MNELLRLSLNGAVLIAVICALRLAFRRYLPRTAFVILWLAAVFRLLCPVKLPSETSFWRLFTAPRSAGTRTFAVSRTVLPGTVLPVRTALPNVCDLLQKLWLLGAAALLIGILALYIRGVYDGRIVVAAREDAYICPKLTSPRVCGIVRPRILLPEGVAEDLLPFILLHERVHIRRGDNLWKLLALIAAAVHWFNPMAWVLVVLLGRDLEVSCDEWVMHALHGEQKREYALSLIAMAEHAARRSPLTCGFSRNPLEERICNIMSNRKTSMIALSAATAMILCTTAAFATDVPELEKTSSEVGKASVYTVNESPEQDTELVVATESGEAVAVKYELFTADEYEAYLAEQKEALKAEIASGQLSQETYDMTIAEMEETLEGIRNGTMEAVKPITLEDGTVVAVVVASGDAAEIEGYDVNYEIESNGIATVSIANAEEIVDAE